MEEESPVTSSNHNTTGIMAFFKKPQITCGKMIFEYCWYISQVQTTVVFVDSSVGRSDEVIFLS